MKELENMIGAELNDAELELISGRGEGGYGDKGGYGGKGGIFQGGRSDVRLINNFSFRSNTNVSGAAGVSIPLSDFACNSFSNTYIGGGYGY